MEEYEYNKSCVKTKGICVTVAHRTLTPFAGVRIPHPLPKTTDIHSDICCFFVSEEDEGFELKMQQDVFCKGIFSPAV